MAQFTPNKKTITDFNDGEEYRNKIDIPQAQTINNLVEGLLYAQENGGGTTMLTEGREFGKELKENDYLLDVIGEANTIAVSPKSSLQKPILKKTVPQSQKEMSLSPVQETNGEICLTYIGEDKWQTKK